jgi:AraC-like DNA-binding protein
MDLYAEVPPPPELRGFVRAFWRIERESGGEHLIVPDAVTDLVIRDGEAIAAGVDTRPSSMPARAGATILGVRLRPGAAADVLGIPASELRDLRVALDELWGADGRAFAEDPVGVLLRRLRGRAPGDVAAARAASLIERAAPLPAVADAVGLGERQLRRRFIAAVGYGPKTFARIVRFQRALARIRGGEPLAATAAECGYADQAHMSRDVAELAGRTPGALA